MDFCSYHCCPAFPSIKLWVSKMLWLEFKCEVIADNRGPDFLWQFKLLSYFPQSSWNLFLVDACIKVLVWGERESEKIPLLSQRSWSSTENRMTQCKVWPLGKSGALIFKPVTPWHTLVTFPHRITVKEFPWLLPWPETTPLLILVIHAAGTKTESRTKTSHLA